MVGDYYIECCIGIKHIECLDVLFGYLVKENCIDKINLLIAIPNALEHVKKCIIQHPALHNKIAFFVCNYIDNSDEIRKKYKNSNTIYLYLEDDICYLSPKMIEILATWHIDNQHLVSYPSIANTGTTTFIWQVMGILPIFKSISSKIEDTDYYWVDCINLSSQDTIVIHNQFLSAIDNGTNLSFYRYHLYRAHEMYKQCYMWKGSEDCSISCAKLFEQYPEKFCINGDTMASHFAFQSHRNELNKTNLLYKYSKLC